MIIIRSKIINSQNIICMKRRVIVLSLFILYVACINAQVYENPVFDRSDVTDFRIEKVEITHDMTCIHCLYSAEEQSWASLSDNTYLENIKEGTRYPITKVFGIPFSPKQRTFENDTLISVLLCFPKINFTNFNLIEDENSKSFNIYGINLNNTYSANYTYEQYLNCGFKASRLDSLGRINEAIAYKREQLEMARFLYGVKSYECAAALYDICLYNTSDADSAIPYGERALQILNTIPTTDIIKEDIARICGSLMTLYIVGNKNFEIGFNYGEK